MLTRIRAMMAGVLALLLLCAPGALAQDATPAAPTSILEAYGAAWSSGDAAQVAALYTGDAVRIDVPTATTSDGRDAIEALATALFATDSDVRLEVTDGFAGDDWAVVEWTFTGQQQASGREVTFKGAAVLELQNGLIREERDYYDLPDMMAQITGAATPAP